MLLIRVSDKPTSTPQAHHKHISADLYLCADSFIFVEKTEQTKSASRDDTGRTKGSELEPLEGMDA